MTITDWEEKMSLFFIFGWYSLLIAIIGDLLVSTILSLFYKEYNIATMSISALGNPESVKLKNQISSKVSLQAKNKAKSSHSKCTQKVHENWKTPAFYAIIEVDKSGIGCGKNEL